MNNKVDTITRFSPLDIPTIIKAHWRSTPKVPANFIAAPSTVKSDGTRQTAIELAKQEHREFCEWNKISITQKKDIVSDPSKYFIFADLRASETDIGELRLQDLQNGHEYITFKYNILFRALSEDSSMGILFFDEMNLAPNMIKAQFYKIINDGAVGDIPLSKNVLCLSAGNESEHARGVTDDPVPLVLRRGNYFLRPLTADEYSEYAVRVHHHPYIVGYLGFQPQDTHLIQYDVPDSVGQPCPRTWSKLSAILSANNDLNIREVEMFATGLVGQGVAKKFSAYVKSAQEIDLDDLIKNPSKVKAFESSDQLSIVYAIISGVVDKYRNSHTSVMKPAFEMSLHMARPEFGAFLLRSIKAVDEKEFMKRVGNPAIIPSDLMDRVVDKYARLLRE